MSPGHALVAHSSWLIRRIWSLQLTPPAEQDYRVEPENEAPYCVTMAEQAAGREVSPDVNPEGAVLFKDPGPLARWSGFLMITIAVLPYVIVPGVHIVSTIVIAESLPGGQGALVTAYIEKMLGMKPGSRQPFRIEPLRWRLMWKNFWRNPLKVTGEMLTDLKDGALKRVGGAVNGLKRWGKSLRDRMRPNRGKGPSTPEQPSTSETGPKAPPETSPIKPTEIGKGIDPALEPATSGTELAPSVAEGGGGGVMGEVAGAVGEIATAVGEIIAAIWSFLWNVITFGSGRV